MDVLGVLINALSAEEKAYFRRYGYSAADKLKTNGQKLFDLIEAHPLAEDEELKNRLRKESWAKQLAVHKHQLYRQLLQCLIHYHVDERIELELHRMMEQVYFLQLHALDEPALRWLQKLEEKAAENEMPFMQMEACQMLMRHYGNQALSEGASDGLSELMKRRAELFERMAIQETIDQLYAEQLLLMKEALHSRDQQVMQRQEEIFSHPYIQQLPTNSQSLSRHLRHCIRLHYFMISNQGEQHFLESKEAVEWVESNDIIRKRNFSGCLWIYMQFLHAAFYRQDRVSLEKGLNILQSLKAQNEFEEIALFMYYCPFALHWFDLRGEEAQMIELLEEAEKKFKVWGTKIRPDVRLAGSISCISAWVETGAYSRALDWIEDYLSNYNNGLRIDALLMLYFYQLICHIEMGNTQYVENVLPNVYRYFLRHEYKGPLEDAMMKFFRKLIGEASEEKRLRIFEELKSEVEEVAQSGAAAQQHQSLIPVIITYMDSKISGTPYHLYLKQLKRPVEG